MSAKIVVITSIKSLIFNTRVTDNYLTTMASLSIYKTDHRSQYVSCCFLAFLKLCLVHSFLNSVLVDSFGHVSYAPNSELCLFDWDSRELLTPIQWNEYYTQINK